MKSHLKICGLLIASILPTHTLAATPIQVFWVIRDGDWSQRFGWSTGVVPNNGSGQTYDVTLSGCSTTIPPFPCRVYLDLNVTIDTLTIETPRTLFVNTGRRLTVDGPVTIHNKGALSFLSASSGLFNGPVTNQGKVSFAFDTPASFNGPVTNQGEVFMSPGAVLSVKGDLVNQPGPGLGNLSVTSAALDVTGSLVNNGQMFVGRSVGFQQRGSITAAQFLQNRGSTNIAAGGTMTGNVTVTGGRFLQAAGDAILNGNFELDGGRFEAPCDSTVPCSPALVNGNFSVDADGTYVQNITRTRGHVIADNLSVSGDVNLAGTLDLTFKGSFFPGDSIDFMSYLAETGEFSAVDVAGLLPGQEVILDYGPDVLSAEIAGTAPVPEPASLLLMGTGILALLSRRTSARKSTPLNR